MDWYGWLIWYLSQLWSSVSRELKKNRDARYIRQHFLWKCCVFRYKNNSTSDDSFVLVWNWIRVNNGNYRRCFEIRTKKSKKNWIKRAINLPNMWNAKKYINFTVHTYTGLYRMCVGIVSLQCVPIVTNILFFIPVNPESYK